MNVINFKEKLVKELIKSLILPRKLHKTIYGMWSHHVTMFLF